MVNQIFFKIMKGKGNISWRDTKWHLPFKLYQLNRAIWIHFTERNCSNETALVSHMTIFQFLQVLLLFSVKLSTTTRGVQPPKLPGSIDQFPFDSTWPFSLTRDKKGTTWLQWEGDNSTLTYGWWDTNAFAWGWIIIMLLAEETLTIFLLAGISNINIFFIKKKINGLFYSNIHDKFTSTNITFKLQKKLKIGITQLSVKKIK